QRFGAGLDVVGQTARLNDEAYTIVGVMPPDVDFPGKANVWVVPHYHGPDDPLLPSQDPSAQRSHGYISVLGRLKPGIAFETAMADMDAVGASLEHDYPNANQNSGIWLIRLRDDLVADVRAMVLLLFGAVGLVLLIATANVSGLLIARSTARHQEIAVRIALGATRRRILAQLLTESVLLAAAGGAGGVVLAVWLVAPLVRLSPSDLAVVGDISVDARVVLFGLALSTAAGLLFGLAPARQLARLDVHHDLKQSARRGGASGQRHVRSALVVAEIALSLVLLVAAGLTIRSFIRLQNVPTGFDADDVLTVTVSLPSARYATPDQPAVLWDRALESLRGLPGVRTGGATSRLPLLPGHRTPALAPP